jgi:[ribosomal protein S5]-alanine N-acetyltransferase
MGVVRMNPDIILQFEGGYARPLRPTDVHEGYVNGLNDPEVHRFLEGPRYLRQTVQNVIEFVEMNEHLSNAILWGIWVSDHDHHVGTFRLHSIENRHGTAGVGVCLFDKAIWGKGLGTKAIRVVTQWALKALDLRWIEAGIYEENIGSQKAFLGAGYVWEYDIPGKFLHEGKPTTVNVFVAKPE